MQYNTGLFKMIGKGIGCYFGAIGIGIALGFGALIGF